MFAAQKQPNGRRQINWLKSILTARSVDIKRRHLNYRAPQNKGQALLIIAVDCSASAMVGGALVQIKGAVQQLLQQAYFNRQRVALVSFSGRQVKTLLGVRRPPKDYQSLLDAMFGGGGTPLRLAFLEMNQLCLKFRQQVKGETQVALFTDGRSNDELPMLNATTLIVDTEFHRVPLGRCKMLAKQLNADYVHLRDLPVAPSAIRV